MGVPEGAAVAPWAVLVLGRRAARVLSLVWYPTGWAHPGEEAGQKLSQLGAFPNVAAAVGAEVLSPNEFFSWS